MKVFVLQSNTQVHLYICNFETLILDIKLRVKNYPFPVFQQSILKNDRTVPKSNTILISNKNIYTLK